MIGIKFYKAIVFCSNPLTGLYRFKDVFQVYPFISDIAPQSDKVKLFAIAIEYCVDNAIPVEVHSAFTEASDILAKMTQSQNRQKEILNLLSSITNYRFSYPIPELNWFVSVPNGEMTEEMNKQKSIGGMSLYWYPELYSENQITSFSAPSFPAIELINHPDYFAHIDIENKEQVKFPQYIDHALEKYFSLNQDAKQAINSSASLICNGLDLRTKMKSLSFVSFVSSIETMVNYEFRNETNENCQKCNRPLFRIAGKFRDYLFKYASHGENSKKKIDKIYSIRSRIIHNGLLLFGDNLVDWSDDKRQGEEWQKHIESMQISRLSLVNWLLLN